MFPREEYHRVVAHPPSQSIDAIPIRINQLQRNVMNDNMDNNMNSKIDHIQFSSTDKSNDFNNSHTTFTNKKIVMCIGPEGGWEDEEVLLLIENGFKLVSMGDRILRTDMAVDILLGLAHDYVDNIG